MSAAQVHYEVFVVKSAGAGWTLEMATEDRAGACAAAEALIAERRALAVRVTKETLDPETRGFRSAEILSLGDAKIKAKKVVRDDLEPLCVAPQDLYTVHARSRIARLLEGWLERNRATPFELLHRPDLVEKLESSGTDLQHALQKIAVPEAQERGASVHELMRAFQSLTERAIEKVLKDARKGVLVNLEKEGFAAACERLSRDPERAYLLGAGVAGRLAPAKNWADKVSRLLDLADAAPAAGPARGLALSVLEQPLSEILGAKGGLDEVLGDGLDLGATLAAMTRLAAADAVERLIAVDKSLQKIMPTLPPAAERLAKWLTGEEFESVRQSIGKRVLRELNGPRRLRPSSAESEIDVLRGLALALSAAAGRLLPLDDVQAAFAARSKMLTTGDFVQEYLGEDRSARQEAEALIWLVENVIGAANKRQAGRYLVGVVTALRFEKEMRYGPDSPATRLASLAKLQRAVARCGLATEDFQPIQQTFGTLGGQVEADGKLAQTVARAGGPVVHRLTLLLRLASGEAAPLGPAADRARAEALKLVRLDETRAELSKYPQQMDQVRQLMHSAGKAA